jgi:CRISPR-associated protein Cas5t
MQNRAEPVLVVTVEAPVASFRTPLDHNYQRTLLMPPPTTLLGIAGAALGVLDGELWGDRSPLKHTRVAVWMERERGRARDMWTVLKIKSNRIAERSPYFRELLFFTRYALIYGDSENLLRQLEEKFLDPAYPLSLGREDELLRVEEITLEYARDGEPVFRGTVIPGDVRQMKFRNFSRLEPGLRFEPAVVETLPLRFRVDVDKQGRHIRHPEELKPLSFLPFQPEVQIESPPLRALRCRGRNFVWMNS